MHTLIITAHPNPGGFTHKIANTYQKTKEKQGAKVEILNLYTTKHQQGFLTLNEKNRYPETDEVRSVMQDKIDWADELVFVFPLWRGDCPAIMKNFFDVNFTSGFAYKYSGGLIPIKLLTGKRARVFVTAGGPSWFYSLILRPMKTIWWLIRMDYCGINLKSFTIFGSMGERRQRTEESRKKMLIKVMKKAMK